MTDYLDMETRPGPVPVRDTGAQPIPCLTILHHPELPRAGERCLLPELMGAGQVALSRAEPLFAESASERGRPLMSSYVSRKPVQLFSSASTIGVGAAATSTAVRVDGESVSGVVEVARTRLGEGVVITLAGSIVMLLHNALRAPLGDAPDFGLVGRSDAMVRVRVDIARAARSDRPVLIRGETGTGKELVARAVHDAGSRASGPWLATNLGAVPASLAASTLFGHTRGAFSGATEARYGLFERAHGGSLFLDEVGEAPEEVQVALLRALETGEIQRVGADRNRRVDVRLVAATDADLEQRAEAGAFRAPLLFRLASHPIALPPLRERREDLGEILVHFLESALKESGRETLLEQEEPWLPGHLVERLALYDWPGNVRQLRSVALALAERAADGEILSADMHVLGQLMPQTESGSADPLVAEARDAPAKPPRAMGPEDIETVMRESDYELARAARALGVSRPTLRDLVDQHPTLRRATAIDEPEIRAALDAAGGDVDAAWRALRVSRRSLLLRMRELGIRS